MFRSMFRKLFFKCFLKHDKLNYFFKNEISVSVSFYQDFEDKDFQYNFMEQRKSPILIKSL